MTARSKLGLLVAAVSIAVLAVGASSALAHGGPGMGGRGGPFGKAGQKADLLTPAAKSLGISVEKLEQAILGVASAKIDKAVADEKIDADDAADIKDDLADNAQAAIPLTSATAVARSLGITKKQLDDAFRAARKAAYISKIDQSVADEKIDEDTAADLKADLEDAKLPGYKPSLFLGRGLGGGFGGPGHPSGHPFGRHR